jgi:hypothetical protein
MTRDQFKEYVDYFNNHRFDKVTSYFCPDVTLAYPDNLMGSQIPGVTGSTLHGPNEFIAQYEAIAANVREVLNVGAFLSEGNQFVVELVTEFHNEKDPPKTIDSGNWKKGDVIVMNQMVLYNLDGNGKFKRMRIFHHRNLDPKEVQLH